MKSNKLTFSFYIFIKYTFTMFRRTKKGFCEMRILIVDENQIIFVYIAYLYWLRKINCDYDFT